MKFVYVIAGVIIIGSIFFIKDYFTAKDGQKINLNQPLKVGDVILEGTVRFPIPQESLSAFSSGGRDGMATFRRMRTIKMLKNEYAYIYQGIENGEIEVECKNTTSAGKQLNKILHLTLQGNETILKTPAIESLKSRKVKIKVLDNSGQITATEE